jgi:hypothetical protein
MWSSRRPHVHPVEVEGRDGTWNLIRVLSLDISKLVAGNTYVHTWAGFVYVASVFDVLPRR